MHLRSHRRDEADAAVRSMYAKCLNAIFYVLSTGCQWKAMPKDLPPKSTAHFYFMLWEWDKASSIVTACSSIACALRSHAMRGALEMFRSGGEVLRLLPNPPGTQPLLPYVTAKAVFGERPAPIGP